ncbi:methyltransferase domain-containing protein [Nocardioides sp. YIM 152315]|uniref:class I SAM-dependent methyltransferase n=1 Tax=Nocardioides sp. YIM 152315 TaxID=3031760 RepID=UPI0023DC2884|nr:methyltransferase domain-containing protein [Nocardioides sp. YIM 152315]MDF1602532.1 methyltransferase domain-containing protein [Nocardioides sp. YIM 152315]
MAFDVAADAYDRFMGRYSAPLADQLLDALGVQPGERALDVGCGPGALTARLVDLLGADLVAAVDPSPPFVDAVRARLPGVDARSASAEELPFDDDVFDLVLAQLVVPFLRAPDTGLHEMARVTRPGGVVAATAWNHAEQGSSPLSPFWAAVNDVDQGAYDESSLVGVGDGELVRILRSAGLDDVRQLRLTVTVTHPTFEEWWEPYTLGVGPAGDHVTGLSAEQRSRLERRARERLGDGPFDVTGTAWCAVGRA